MFVLINVVEIIVVGISSSTSLVNILKGYLFPLHIISDKS